MKARTRDAVTKFTDIPNVGPRIADDFKTLGIKTPKELIGTDGYVLYQALCKKTKTRHDPCVLDTFMAVADFMNGGIPRKWFYFTKTRKKLYPDV